MHTSDRINTDCTHTHCYKSQRPHCYQRGLMAMKFTFSESYAKDNHITYRFLKMLTGKNQELWKPVGTVFFLEIY